MDNEIMIDYKCKKCGRLLFNANIEYGVVKAQCPDCGEVLELNGDSCKIEGERAWEYFKSESDFYNLVLRYNAKADTVNFAEKYAPRVYALFKRMYPNERVRFELNESELSTYFAVHIMVEYLDGDYYIPYHSELIGMFENENEDED